MNVRGTDKRVATIAALLAAALYTPALAAVEYNTSPGRYSVHAFDFHCCSTNPAAPLITTTLQRAKPGSVLEIHVAMEKNFDLGDQDVGMRVAVNGHPTTSRDIFQNPCDENATDAQCSVNGVFFLDVDRAEELFPGEFAGRELVIEVFFVPKHPDPTVYVGVDVTVAARTRRK